jgi:hypothetical protein
MKKRYFNTREAAERHLEVRRKAQYNKIEKKGWKVIKDNSFTHQNDFCYCEHLPWTHKNKGKWFAVMAIVTDEMIKDIQNFQTIDYEAELEKVIKDAEKIDKRILNEITRESIKRCKDFITFPNVNKKFS